VADEPAEQRRTKITNSVHVYLDFRFADTNQPLVGVLLALMGVRNRAPGPVALAIPGGRACIEKVVALARWSI
jgi:hypothetical protein